MRLDFCIIGAMKSATTTLYALLAEHPGVVMADRLTPECIGKEPGYFSRDERFALGEAWYAQHFSHFDGVLVGEGSTCYSRRIPFPDAAPRLAAFAPGAKLIYVLRHPADRAIAHYRHEMRRLFSKDVPIPDFETYCSQDPAVLSASEYDLEIEHLSRWFPREQLLLLRFEDLISDQASVLGVVQRWLGLEPIAAAPVWANKSIDGVRYQVVKSRLRKITSNPVLKATGRVLPGAVKESARAFLTKKIESTAAIEHEVQHFEDSLVVPTGPEYQALVDRYAGTVSAIEEMTDWDLSDWRK